MDSCGGYIKEGCGFGVRGSGLRDAEVSIEDVGFGFPKP